MQNSEIIIYENDSGLPDIKVRVEGETVWLSQAQLAELFDTSRPNITMHIKNIFEEQELNDDSVCKDFLHTASDGKKYNTKHYNLDLIATSKDYNPQNNESIAFFKVVQNKLHYVAHGHTAAEVIAKRADPVSRLWGYSHSQAVMSAKKNCHHQIWTILPLPRKR